MSEEGDKTCPLCAEEMDLTDQQLKPCKCGYDICVWCWHHIMDMAEKDQTKGRCPACRTPYNKEKIVTAASSGRLASELNVERRAKSQKGKSKTEGRKHLASVRVIQKNLVYVVGLPLNFADEDLLQRREYFGQYGKVLKVSISRTAAGAIQQFPNSTCSVYITYSKEDEAVRCIQAVHGFVLDGKPLRACFGTTKYCHAWLRNVPCNNPDCLYLHEIGSQEDSFTKDEIVSAYTRSRVQQFAGSSNTAQQRSGNVLPPPADDYCNNGSTSLGKPMHKPSVSTNQNPAISSRISPPNSSSGRSSALPAGASWGTRASSSQNTQASRPCSNGPLIQKPDVFNISETSSSTVITPSQKSLLQRDDGEKLAPNNASSISQNDSKEEMVEKEFKADGWIDDADESIVSGDHIESLVNGQSHAQLSVKSPSNATELADNSLDSDRSGWVKDSWDLADQSVNDVSSDFSVMSIHQNQHVDNGCVEVIREPMTEQTSLEVANKSVTACSSAVQPDHGLGIPHATQVDFRETDDDLLSFESRRFNDPEVSFDRVDKVPPIFNLSRHSSFNSSLFNDVDNSTSNDLYRKVVDRESELMFPTSSRNQENIPNSSGAEVNDAGYFNLFPSEQKQSLIGSYERGATNNRGDDSIISNILSTDFDMWNDSLSSTHNLVKLLGEGDGQQGFFGAPGTRRMANSSQSRFPFAREEESINQVSDFRQSIDYFEKAPEQHPLGYGFSSSNNSHSYNFDRRNDLSLFSGSESDLFASILPRHSSSKLSVPRSPMPAPPGFSASSRPPPPGFASHERTEQQLLDNFSGNHMLEASSLSRNQYHTPSPAANVFSDGDIEFMDPAILAVGKGMLATGLNNSGLDIGQSLPPQFAMSEEARFQSLLHRSLPPQQNQRFNNSRDSFSLLSDAVYGIPSRVMEQTLANGLSSFSQSNLPQTRNGVTSNGQWNSWSEIHGGKNMGMPEYLRTEGLGINKFFGGHEDSQIRMPGSGSLFNGTYGI